MRRLRVLPILGLSLLLLLAVQGPALAAPSAAATPQTLVIGVDYRDPANQDPANNRVFEYTDFFTRKVKVHTGDTINFRTAPGAFHIVALAKFEAAARAAYPILAADAEDPILAIGTGLPKVEIGPAINPITDGTLSGGGTIWYGAPGPVCGTKGQPICTFAGGNDVEVAGPNLRFDRQGNPIPADWLIQINAPPGNYVYFCEIHPGMRGTVTVVEPGGQRTGQTWIDSQSRSQFLADRQVGLAAEARANQIRFRGGAPGTRTYSIYVGTYAGDYVAINEMLPKTLDLKVGDRVQYIWDDPHNVHTVGFPDEAALPVPIGFDCGATFSPTPTCVDPVEGRLEMIGDPGLSPSGTVLTDPSAVVDAGMLIGGAYRVVPSSQRWAIATNAGTQAGTYSYQCTVHDYMHGWLNVSQ